MLWKAGVMMLSAGQAVNDIDSDLHEIAAAYGATRVRFFVLPTGLFVRVDVGSAGQTDFAPSDGGPLRLDQIGALALLVRDLKKAQYPPIEAIRRLSAISRSRPRFGPAWVVLGQTLLTLGFGLTLDPAARALPVYVGLGAMMGLFMLLPRRYPRLTMAFPVFAAFLVTILAVWIGSATSVGNVQLLAPPLVSLLPGYVLTVATIELTSSQIISGASRMIFGFSQLLLLTFGVFAGMALTGGFDDKVTVSATLGWWTPWAGLVFVAIGYFYYSSAPRRSLPWLVIALFCVVLAQQVGNVLIGNQLSGFIAGMVIVPVSQIIAQFRTGPAAAVVLLPSFWILVPSSLGFIGLAEVATDQIGGLQSMVNMGIAVLAIALGVMVGSSITTAAGALRASWLESDAPPEDG
jgi:uncharacterized membrane protein YjjP (DUF1212 family)